MSGILTNGAHGFEVKVLYVKDALEEAFFEHFDQETGDAAHDEAADDVLLSHHFRDKGRCGERSAARTSLKRKAVLKKAGSSDRLGGVLSDDELHRVFRHLGCAGNNAVGIADLLELNDPVDAFLRNGDRRERIRLQIVRDGNDLIGIVRIREGVAQRAAGRLARDAIDVAVCVGRRRCNEGDVDVEVAAFNGAGSAAVRTENSSSGEESRGDGLGYWSADVVGIDACDDAGSDEFNKRGVHGEDRACRDAQILDPALGSRGNHLVHQHVAVAEMMMEAERHAAFQADLREDGVKVRQALGIARQSALDGGRCARPRGSGGECAGKGFEFDAVELIGNLAAENGLAHGYSSSSRPSMSAI